MISELDELTEADVVVLLDTLDDLQSRVVDDLELARLHQKAVTCAATDKGPYALSSGLSVLFAWFCQHWLEVASVDDEARPLVEQMWMQIKSHGESVMWEHDPVLINDTIKAVRSHPKFDALAPMPKLVHRQGAARVDVTPRGTTRESSPRRSRTRSGSSRDGPSRSDDDPPEPDDVARPRGRLGVLAGARR